MRSWMVIRARGTMDALAENSEAENHSARSNNSRLIVGICFRMIDFLKLISFDVHYEKKTARQSSVGSSGYFS